MSKNLKSGIISKLCLLELLCVHDREERVLSMMGIVRALICWEMRMKCNFLCLKDPWIF